MGKNKNVFKIIRLQEEMRILFHIDLIQSFTNKLWRFFISKEPTHVVLIHRKSSRGEKLHGSFACAIVLRLCPKRIKDEIDIFTRAVSIELLNARIRVY